MQDTIQLLEPACKSWILSSGNIHVAIGEFELLYIIAGWQRYILVPRSPIWCHHVFLWQGHLLPLFDIEVYINTTMDRPAAPLSNTGDFTGVIAYENQHGQIHYGGLKLSSPPVIKVVSDDAICDYPDNYPEWSRIALSCFEDPGIGSVPILDIQQLFCARPQAVATITDNADI